MDALKRFYTRFFIFTKIKLCSFCNCTSGNIKKCLFGPLSKPINSAAIHERWEHSKSGSEDFTKRWHSKDNVNVLFNSCQVSLEHIHFVDSKVFAHTFLATNEIDWLEIFIFVKRRDIASIKDIVDVFNHLFIDNLSIYKQESCWLIVNTCLH